VQNINGEREDHNTIFFSISSINYVLPYYQLWKFSLLKKDVNFHEILMLNVSVST